MVPALYIKSFPAHCQDVWYLAGSLIGLSDLSPAGNRIKGALVERLSEVRCDHAYDISVVSWSCDVQLHGLLQIHFSLVVHLIYSELLVSKSCEVVVSRAEPQALFDMMIFWERRYKME